MNTMTLYMIDWKRFASIKSETRQQPLFCWKAEGIFGFKNHSNELHVKHIWKGFGL